MTTTAPICASESLQELHKENPFKFDEIQEARLRKEALALDMEKLFGQIPPDRSVQLIELLKGCYSGKFSFEDADRFCSGVDESLVLDTYREGLGILGEIVTLEEKYKPELIGRMVGLACDISRRFDWDALIDYYHNSKDRSQLPGEATLYNRDRFLNAVASTAYIRAVLGLYKDGELDNLSYDELERMANRLYENALAWDSRGFLRTNQNLQPSLNKSPKATDPERIVKIKDRISVHLGLIEEFNRLKGIFRDSLVGLHDGEGILPQMNISLQFETGYRDFAFSSFQKYNLDPNYLDAIERYVDRLQQEFLTTARFPEDDPQVIEILKLKHLLPLEETVNGVNFEGFEAEEVRSIVTIQEIKDLITKTVPVCFLPNTTVRIIGPQKGFTIANGVKGDCIVLFDEDGGVKKTLVRLYLGNFFNRFSADSIVHNEQNARLEVFQTLLHEMAHGIHAGIDFEDMRQWIEVVKGDPSAVTPYVKESREKGLGKGYREDFCETFMLFMLAPSYLRVASESRFQYMMALMVKYMGDEQYRRFSEYHRRKRAETLWLERLASGTNESE